MSSCRCSRWPTPASASTDGVPNTRTFFINDPGTNICPRPVSSGLVGLCTSNCSDRTQDGICSCLSRRSRARHGGSSGCKPVSWRSVRVVEAPVYLEVELVAEKRTRGRASCGDRQIERESAI
jgi:hypothetical protein